MKVVCHIKDQLLREYLHAIFAFEDGAFSIFRDTKEGKFICSMLKHSSVPVKQKIDEKTAVYFKLPRTSAMRSLFRQCSYISDEDQVKIADFLKASFDLDFTVYYHVGISMGLQQKIVIQNFILARKLVSKIGDVEQLKKRAYRAEEKQLHTMYERLARRVRAQHAVVRKTIEEYQAIL